MSIENAPDDGVFEAPEDIFEVHTLREGVPGVNVRLGLTKNIGGFESVRVDIEYKDIVEEDETHGEACDRLYDDAEAKVVEKVKELNSTLTPKRRAESKINPE